MCNLMLNEFFILQLLILITLFFFFTVTNIISLWYVAGIYLLSLGLFLLLNDGDIFIGFLWVIDLGVGLIFLIFILHFSNFLYQKSTVNLSNKFFIALFFIAFFFIAFFFFLSQSWSEDFNLSLQKSWFFYLSFYDYYEIFNIFTVTDLSLLKEIYFFNNSFEFFLINFVLFYGLFASINLCFLIKRVFTFLNFSQYNNLNFLHEMYNVFFIRNQNFIKQQSMPAGTRVWLKKKFNKF